MICWACAIPFSAVAQYKKAANHGTMRFIARIAGQIDIESLERVWQSNSTSVTKNR
jgi:hypothetical protein